jgi:Tol biopolymer transport system component
LLLIILFGAALWVLLAPSETSDLRIAYLSPDANGAWQLFIADADGDNPLQLTHHDNAIINYDIAPDNATIVYTVERPDGGGDIWSLGPDQSADAGLLLECTNALCANPIWSADGEAILFERTPRDLTDATRLWWLTPDGAISPLFADETILGRNPQFSTDGSQIAFFSPSAEAIILYQRETGESIILPTIVDTPVVWHPDGTALLFRDIQVRGEQFGIRMLRYDMATGTVTDLTEDSRDDEFPYAWTTAGEIIFGRKRAQTAMGRQIWQMDNDGTLRMFTRDATIQHSVVSLAPDESTLLMQQFDIEQAAAQPEIWLLDRASGAMETLLPHGIQPQWLP